MNTIAQRQDQAAYWSAYAMEHLFRYLDGRRAKIPESDLAMIREAAILGQMLARFYGEYYL